jgi:coenzyme F420 hydrogenase subunit beta
VKQGKHHAVIQDDATCVRDVFAALQDEVIEPGLCTHCGTCVGLSDGHLAMTDTCHGPLPTAHRSQAVLDHIAYEACPGKGLDYPALNQFVFGALPRNWLVGHVRKSYVGYATDEAIRQHAASGGVITRALIYLLEHRMIDGAIILCQGRPTPWQAEPIIASNVHEVLQASQSVYVPAPVNTILAKLHHLSGRFAYVGLPDQIASIRKLQQLDHADALKIVYTFGVYCGTVMYFDAVRSFLRSHGIHNVADIAQLHYRAGEWPGNLQIITTSGTVITVEKFYYNYLIPFYITRSTLLAVDFTNELADISVGDAWHPRYEKDRKGYSVVLARSEKGETLLQKMHSDRVLMLEEQPLDLILSMHGHMIDFKKRGAFIRMQWRHMLGKNIPQYGYAPKAISISRYLVEVIISGLFCFGQTKVARKMVEHIPIAWLGPCFNVLRKAWKNVSKPAKRKGLAQYDVTYTRQ